MKLRHYLLALLAVGACTIAAADTDDVPNELATKIRAAFKQSFPDVTIEGVHKGPLPGLIEVNTGAEILYVNEAGTLVFAGHMIDMKTRTDLTGERWNTLNAIDFNTLPFNLALKAVRGNGSRKLAVFADPFCPYCQQLEQQMQGITNVTIYTFLYPIETLHPGASVKSVEIWCAKDPQAAWSNWMLHKTDPGDTRCKGVPIEQLQKLGEKLHIDSTPTLFTSDGRRIRGAIKHNEIEQLLVAAAAKK
jgi:thiol:disulfide interchange protein DsbC